MSTENKKVTLENCEFTSKGKRLNSPNSLNALQLIGVSIDDLNKISLERYIRRHPECRNLPKELIQERYDHFEKTRIDLIKEAQEKRKLLIESNKNNDYIEEEKDNKKEKPKLDNEEEKEEGEEKKEDEENKEEEKKEGEENKEEEKKEDEENKEEIKNEGDEN